MKIDARIFPLGCEFLLPFLEPYGCITGDVRDADLVLALNNTAPDHLNDLKEIRSARKPVAWWTIEDPNAFDYFLDQARQADFVFTSDEACIPRYQQRLGHERVFWLPLACSPSHHTRADALPDAADFVISANWYDNEARLWSVKTVVDPLRLAGRELLLYCYENFMWPDVYRPYWRGRTHYLTVATQYQHGRVVIGLNNQRSGHDRRGHTVMTSMRTFEALACGKPLLAAHSDAFTRLGMHHGEHLASVRTQEETLEWADRLLGAEGRRIAEAGRAAVLEHHTYGHRLTSIVEAVGKAAIPERPATPYECECRRLERRCPKAVELAREHDNPNMRYPELLALADAMLRFCWQPGQYLCEIGTFHGSTAAFLGRVADLVGLPCQVLSVDSFESPYLKHLAEPSAEYYKAVSARGLFPRRNLALKMKSSDARPYLPDGIGVLVVDAGHEYEDCLSDLEGYSQKLAPGGALAVDDVWYDSVRRATDEFHHRHPEFVLELCLEKLEIYRKSS
jgi:spore maturation protein CgeB